MHPVPLAWNHVRCILETMHVHQKSDKKVQYPTNVEKLKLKFKPLTFQHKSYVYGFHFHYPDMAL